MSLVDDIYNSGADNQEHPLDELGLAIWDNIEYYVARAIAISRRNQTNRFSIYQLYTDTEKIFNGHKEVEENYENINVLTETTRKFSTGEKVMFWKILKQCLPVLNLNYIQISNDLIWDKSKGKVINIKEDYESQVSTKKYKKRKKGSKAISQGLQS